MARAAPMTTVPVPCIASRAGGRGEASRPVRASRVRSANGSRSDGRKTLIASAMCDDEQDGEPADIAADRSSAAADGRRGCRGLIADGREGHPLRFERAVDDPQAGRGEGLANLGLAVDEDARREECPARTQARRELAGASATSSDAMRLARTTSNGPRPTAGCPAGP